MALYQYFITKRKISNKILSLTLLSTIPIQRAQAAMTHEWHFVNNMDTPVTVSFKDKKCFKTVDRSDITVAAHTSEMISADDINSGFCYNSEKKYEYTTQYFKSEKESIETKWIKRHIFKKSWTSIVLPKEGDKSRRDISVMCGVDEGKEIDCSDPYSSSFRDRNSPSWVKTTFEGDEY